MPSMRLTTCVQITNVQLTGLLFLMILGEMAGFIVGFLQNDSGPIFEVDGWSFPVAKGAAQSIKVPLSPSFLHTLALNLLIHPRRNLVEGNEISVRVSSLEIPTQWVWGGGWGNLHSS